MMTDAELKQDEELSLRSSAAWSYLLFSTTLITGLSQTTLAQAESIGISFDLALSHNTIETVELISIAPAHYSARATVTPAPAALGFDLLDAAPKLPVMPSASFTNNHAAEISRPESSQLETVRAISVVSENLDLFSGGSDSLVAKAVGSAEGTRTPEGDRTQAYYGHVDPGNGVWNLGSFSYQHGASSPEEADVRQLQRLRTQTATLQAKAEARNLRLTLEEQLNGVDLANQSPRAALEREGYIDRLAQAQQMGLRSSEAILWARTRSFLNPDTQRWNAPGLGNNVHSISRDQERRQRAIAQSIAAHNRHRDTLQPLPPTIKGTVAEERLISGNAVGLLPPPPEVTSFPPESPAIEQLLRVELLPQKP